MNLFNLLVLEPMDLFPLFHDIAIASLTALIIILFVPVSKEVVVMSIPKKCSTTKHEETIKRILVKNLKFAKTYIQN